MIFETSVLNRRYRLDKKVGQGGFAQVFLTTDLLLDRRVAVKVLNSELTEEGDFQERFAREAKAIATLDHPHILPIYDYGQAEDTAYLVTPYVDGGTLYEKMRSEKNIMPVVALRYLQQMAAALDYAHRRNIVHRDIKPHNMLLRSEDNHLFLADFGISKVLSSTSAQSRTSAIGTISYMSPEQLAGNVGKATDIYALGCVLFQMLTGQVPFIGPTEQVIMGHITGEVPSIVERSQGRLSPTIQQIFNRALAKRPEDRYQTATEMAQDFETALNSGNTGLTNPLSSDYAGPNARTVYAPTERKIPPGIPTGFNPNQPGAGPQPPYGPPSYNTPTHNTPNMPDPTRPYTNPNPNTGSQGYDVRSNPNTIPRAYNDQPNPTTPSHGYQTGPRTNPAAPQGYDYDAGAGGGIGGGANSYGMNYAPVPPPEPPKSGTNWLLIGVGGFVIAALLGVIAFLLIANNSPKTPTPTAQAANVPTATSNVPVSTSTTPVTTAAATTQAPTTASDLSTVTPGGDTTTAADPTGVTTPPATTPAVTTEPATTVASTTLAPTTAVVTTAPPTTQPPTTRPPTTNPPTTTPPTTTNAPTTEAVPGLKINKAIITRALQSLPGETSVFIIYPDGTSTCDDCDRAQPSASVIKLWIAATAYQEGNAKRLNLDEKYTVQKSDIASGTGILVNNVGETLSYRDIIGTMLTYSDNSAANIVIRKLGGFTKVNTYAANNGYKATKLQRLLGDTTNQNNNFTSGRDAATMMLNLTNGKVVCGECSLEILEALYQRKQYSEDQNFFSPKLSTAYQKDQYLHISGTGDKVRNEAGLIPVLNAPSIAIAVLDNNMPDETAAEGLIANAIGAISGAVTTS